MTRLRIGYALKVRLFLQSSRLERMETYRFFQVLFSVWRLTNIPMKKKMRKTFMLCSKTTDFFDFTLDINSLFVPKFTAQHSTALVLRSSGKLAKQAKLATSTSYNSARNKTSGYMHFKFNSQKSRMADTFSLWKTAHDVGLNEPSHLGFYILNFFIGEQL